MESFATPEKQSPDELSAPQYRSLQNISRNQSVLSKVETKAPSAAEEGLTKEVAEEHGSFLSRIPVLGRLFRNKK